MKTHRTTKHLVLAAACTAAGLAASAAPALAQCDIYRLNVPDFDQRRSPAANIQGLPGGGGMHCVPTSYADWVGYINNHGYPDFFDGVQNWELGTYNAVTFLINDLAILCDTDPEGGTNMDNGAIGMQEYFDSYYPGEFTVCTVNASGEYAPSAEEMFHAMEAGQLVTFGTDRYTFTGASNGHPSRWVQSPGGHAQAIIRLYDACTTTPVVYTRNPASDEGNPFNQSPFENTRLDSQAVTGHYASNATSEPVWRSMLRLNPDADYFTVISNVTYMTPKFGLTADAVLGELVFKGIVSKDLTTLPPHTHHTPNQSKVIGVRLHPQFGFAVVVIDRNDTDDSASIVRIRQNGDIETLGTLANAAVTDNVPCTFGRNGEFYIADGSTIRALNVLGPVFVEKGSFTVTGGGISAMTYNDYTNHLVIVCSSRGVIGECAALGQLRSFGSDYTEVAMPATLPLAGHTSAAADPIDGTIVLGSEGSPSLFRLTKIVGAGGYGATAMLLPAIQCCPRNIAIDHRGQVMLTVDGIVHEFRLNPANGQWERDQTAKFDGDTVGDFFVVSASRNSGRDAVEPGLPEQTVPPPVEFTSTHIECRADFNASDTLTVQDLFDYLAAYFSHNIDADFNQSGAITVQDIFDYLAAYFGGCSF